MCTQIYVYYEGPWNTQGARDRASLRNLTPTLVTVRRYILSAF